ncbi:MAG: hypothetical protein R2795_20345 [Saprospiraceae bacterium]
MEVNCKQSLTIFCLITVLFSACTGDNERPLPDVSGISAPFEVQRFEQALFQMDTTDFSSALQQLEEKYPAFTPLFFTSILQAGPLDNPSPEQLAYMRGFVASPVYRAVYDTTQMVFPDTKKLEQDVQQAMRYFRYYFPDIPAPERLVTFNAAFNYAAIIFGDNELGVGLDMFLGPQFDYQRYSPSAAIFSNYLVRTYNKDHLTASLVRVLLDDIFGESTGDRLLDEMIHRGKKLYVLDQLLPHTPDTVKFRVTPAQLTWLQENERNLWAHLLTEDLLYSSRFVDYRKLVEPSPSGAPALPEESPGEAANYIGYLIVKQLMDKNPQLALSDLITYTDAQRLLEQSKYKPPR